MRRRSDPRRQAARRFRKRRQQDREISNTMRDIQRSARTGLAALTASNLASTRTAVATTFARKRVELDARPVPPSPRPVPTPKTLWQAATGEPAPTAKPAPAPEPTKAELVTRVHTPIKAAELDKEMKAAAKRIVQSDTSGGWRLVGVMNREDGRVSVYVRKHGASVRYSMTPA